MILQSLATVLYEAIGFAYGMKYARAHVSWTRDLSGKRKNVAFDIITVCQHNMVNLIFAMMILVEIAICSNPTEENILFLVVMHVFQTPVIGTTILHHMKIYISIGHVIVYTRRMFTMLTTIMVVCCGYIYVFMRLFIMMSVLHSTGGCISQFSDFIGGLYSTFLIFLNTLDLRRLSIGVQEGLHATHICFVFIVGVLLFNLQIALFSDEVNKISANREIILLIDHLWTVRSIDNIGLNTPIVRSIYIHLNQASIKKNFACLEGKMYLVSVDCARKRDIRKST